MRKGALALMILVTFECDRAPDPVGEWTPADHEHPPQQQPQVGPNPSANKLSAAQQLAEAAWAQTCNACHGPMGHGDGPNGSLVKAPDLTREEWQAKVTDEEIATRIRSGKGLMPPNDLPDATVRGLVLRIRALRGQ
jgi:mono/diheme cytochrome c family protein